MTDFVDRLLGRGGIPVIRPMIPTLFEPLSVWCAEEPLPMGAVTDTSRNEPVSGTTESVSKIAEEPRPVRVVEVSEPRPTASTHPTDEKPRPRPARPIAAREPVAQPRPHELPVVKAPPVGAPTVTRPPRSPDTLPARSAKPIRTQPVSLNTPLATTASAVTRRVAATRADRAPEPEVRISIGRVEIRSVASTGEPTRRTDPSKPPRLSLNDYLRDRDGGRRS